MRLCAFTVSFIIFLTSASVSPAVSSLSAKTAKVSATMVLSITFVSDIDEAEPSILNSNLFPVNAKGEVRLRSVLSFLIKGIISAPTVIFTLSALS